MKVFLNNTAQTHWFYMNLNGFDGFVVSVYFPCTNIMVFRYKHYEKRKHKNSMTQNTKVNKNK